MREWMNARELVEALGDHADSALVMASHDDGSTIFVVTGIEDDGDGNALITMEEV